MTAVVLWIDSRENNFFPEAADNRIFLLKFVVGSSREWSGPFSLFLTAGVQGRNESIDCSRLLLPLGSSFCIFFFVKGSFSAFKVDIFFGVRIRMYWWFDYPLSHPSRGLYPDARPEWDFFFSLYPLRWRILVTLLFFSPTPGTPLTFGSFDASLMHVECNWSPVAAMVPDRAHEAW